MKIGNLEADKQAPVFVSGATGYVAGALIKCLLHEGFRVHAAVRDPECADKMGYLKSIASSAPGSIRFFKADLLNPGAYDAAMKGCHVVYHTASVVKFKVSDPLKELIDPALEGTRNILDSVNRTSCVQRVVLTSSVAAIYSDNIELSNTRHRAFTEEKWNTTASESHNPYGYSKTLAEKKAWEMHHAQSRWNLVVLNPSLIIGPSVNPSEDCESFKLIKRLADGTCRLGAPRWGCGVVDVRDVATAHLNAGFFKEVNGRYIISAFNTDFFEMSQALRKKFGKSYPFARWSIPKWLLRQVGPLLDQNLTKTAVDRNVNLPWIADNTKSVDHLNMTYRPMEQSLAEMFHQMIEVDFV